jgi:membrane-bound ClpP family serine protease
MNMQSQRNIQTKKLETTELQSQSNWLLKQLHRRVLRKVFRRLNRTVPTRRSAVPTEAQKNLVLTGLVLGFVSIFTAIFPVCGLPAALTGLVIGFYGRRATSLQAMSSWAFALSLVGLILAFIYIVVTISIYFSHYLLWT